MDFPCPTVSKQLKSFLGLVNYFLDFIRSQSTIVRPLHALLTNYQRTKRIVWTSEATSAFNEIKEQVSKCTTIHFISDTAPITLHTDASDYDIGGYLFQTIDGKDYPVAFVRKSLSGVIVPGPGSRSYRVPTLPNPTGYYYCTLQLGCRIVVAICSVHLEVN